MKEKQYNQVNMTMTERVQKQMKNERQRDRLKEKETQKGQKKTFTAAKRSMDSQ